MKLDKIINNALWNLCWSLVLLVSGVKLISWWMPVCMNIIGYVFIVIAIISIILNTIVVPIIKSRS